jgi:hypothetical protein
LQKFLGIAKVFEYERDVHLGLAGNPFAAAIDAVLPDQRQGISQEIEGHGEPSTRRTHHRFVMLECVAMFVEYRHKIARLKPSRSSGSHWGLP